MNTVLHLVRKDLRVGGSSIFIYLVLLALNVIAQSPLMPEGPIVTQIARNFLPVITLLVLLTCVVMAVLEDPVAGTSAFWLTRPPRAGTLLTAKALLLGSMVLAYLLSQVLILALNGGVQLTPYLIGGFALGTLPVVAALFVATSMASDPVRFFVTLALGLVAFGVLAVLGNFLADFLLLGGSFAVVSSPTQVASARVVASGLALLAGLALAWHQYATRRTIRTGVLAGLAALAVAGFFVSWKKDFFKAPEIAAEREAALGLDRFQPELRPNSVGLMHSTYEDGAGREHVSLILNGFISTADLPEGWVVRSASGPARLTTAEGRRLEREIADFSIQRIWEQAWPRGFRYVGVDDMEDGPEEGFTVPLVDLPEAEFQALGKTTVSGTVELTLVVARRHIIAEFPLAEGEGYQRAGVSWNLRTVRPGLATMTTASGGVVEHTQALGGVEIELDVRAPDLWLLAAGEGGRSLPYFGDEPVVVLNRDRGERMRRGGGGGSFNAGPGVPVARSGVNLHFYTNGTVDPTWLDGATLAITDDTERLTLTRTLRVEEVPVIQE